MGIVSKGNLLSAEDWVNIRWFCLNESFLTVLGDKKRAIKEGLPC
jgi:hypothetical protein